MDDEILTLKEVAEYLKVNEKTVYRLAADQKLPGFKVGHSWRFKKKDLDQWFKNQQSTINNTKNDLDNFKEHACMRPKYRGEES